MICPECGKENPDGRDACAECGATLAEPTENPEAGIELVPVFETGDAALIPVIRSMLEEEKIEHLVQGEGVQEIVGLGRFGSGVNIAAGPVRFFVRPEDAERAAELLGRLESGDVALPADQDVESS